MNKSELNRSQCIPALQVAELERPIGRWKDLTVVRSQSSLQRSSRRRNEHERFASAAGGFRKSVQGWGGCPATAETAAIRNFSDQQRQTGRLYVCGSAAEAHRAAPEVAALRRSATWMPDPAGILRRMPTQAISPAPLKLPDIVPGSVLRRVGAMTPARPSLAEAA